MCIRDRVYALTAYIYALNEFIPQDAVLDAGSLASIQMPAHVRDGFILDDRPDTAATRSMDCLLYTSDAADDLTRVDLGGRRTKAYSRLGTTCKRGRERQGKR